MSTLPTSFDPRVVAYSLLVASFASYVALDLARRVRRSDQRLSMGWWIGGSIAMGSGIWCMQFVGQLALTLPIAIGYDFGLTIASWAAAIASSAVALYIASGDKLKWHHLSAGALAMGLGIAAMHALGMAAIDLVPGIVWNWQLVIACVVLAICACATSLEIFFLLRKVKAARGWGYQIGAAALMGAALCAMHYTGAAAASFPAGAACLSAGGLSESNLGPLLVGSVITLLIFTLFTSRLDARSRLRTSGLNAKLHSANQKLRQRALRDPLTNLPTRLLFEKRLSQALKRLALAVAQGREGSKVVVLFIDLDGFKPVNDTLGHAVGDFVLKEVAARLRSSVRAGDTVARIGGDEFVMLMECETALVDPVIAARRIVESVGATITAGGRPIQVSCSIGIAAYPEHGPKERLIAHADAAMAEAKRAGGNTWAHFEERMEGARPEMLGLQNDLRAAIERGQLELHYRPKVDARSGETHGAEALLRWVHPTLGMVSPSTFIPLAERFGLIGRLRNWVIEEACRQVEQWARDGTRMNVAVNLSVHQLHEDETSSDARAIVSAVVHLAHDLGPGAVAEGVETPGQRKVLVGLECDELQGCLFARPMRAGEVPGWIRARSLEAGAEPARMRAATAREVGAPGDLAVSP